MARSRACNGAPELLDEGVSGSAIDLEGLCLPPGAVQRKHPLRDEPFLERVPGGERLELADHVGVPPESQIGLHPLAQGGEPKLFQAVDLGLREGLVGEFGERRAAPERERRPQVRGRDVRLVRCHRLPPGLQELGEPVDVELAGLDAQLVPAPAGDQESVAQLTP
jgi:hypothetical protein